MCGYRGVCSCCRGKGGCASDWSRVRRRARDAAAGGREGAAAGQGLRVFFPGDEAAGFFVHSEVSRLELNPPNSEVSQSVGRCIMMMVEGREEQVLGLTQRGVGLWMDAGWLQVTEPTQASKQASKRAGHWSLSRTSEARAFRRWGRRATTAL